ncbi:hypothetical protein BBJ28_00026486, partial [Nothophytophthora sp. Chile5]
AQRRLHDRPHGPRARGFPYDGGAPPSLKLMSNSDRGKYYRRKRKAYGDELARRVAELREEVAALSVSRQVQQELALSQRRTPLSAAAQVVVEYCSLFGRGAPVRLAVDEADATAALVAQATITQTGFLKAVMNDGVRFGDFLGVELLLDQWQRYSLYHAAIEWTLTSLDVIQLAQPRLLAEGADYPEEDGPLVVTITADLRVRFSRRTIEEIFPHLVGDEAFTQSLIGLEVTYACINHFHFDETGKIEWYEPEVDFVGALLSALKSPELVARVLGHALIAKDHMIGDDSDNRQSTPVHPTPVEEVTTDTSVGSPSPSDGDSSDNPLETWPSTDKVDVPSEEPSPASPPNRLAMAFILDE